MPAPSPTVLAQTQQLFGDGVKRTNGGEARRYNLLAAKLMAELVKSLLGPRGLEKMFIDIMGEVTLTKDGATLLRKVDVEHPAAKVLIEASNAVDNAVGDGTTSVVVLAGALVEKAEELLDLGISPATISDGYQKGLEMSLKILESITIRPKNNSDRQVLESLAVTALRSKAISYAGNHENAMAKLVVDAVSFIADFANKRVEPDDIKIEEKPGNISDVQIVQGVVIDKTIDSSGMPRAVENAKILLTNDDLEPKRTKADAEIRISLPSQIKSFIASQSGDVRYKVQKIIDSGVNVVICQGGINFLAQTMFAEAGIISIRRVKENDLLWLEKATGASITRELDAISSSQLGYAEKVHEKFVGDDKMVFVEGCKNPKSVTLLLRAGSKRMLDEYHRSTLDAINVLRDFIQVPEMVAGGGSAEMMLANEIRKQSYRFEGREQIVIQKFAAALEEIPLTIARNAGMDVISTRSQMMTKAGSGWYGINAIERKVDEMLSLGVVDPKVVKEQVIKTAVEVVDMLIRVDDVLMAKPVHSHGHTHSHDDGTTHSHDGGDKKHDHYFDRLGKKQRPMHHYY